MKADFLCFLCIQFNLPMKSHELLEDRLDKVIAKPNWNPEINCEERESHGFIGGAEKC